jgi:hypothetical protein
MKNKNIYIDSLKYGADHLQRGVSYIELRKHLLESGHEIPPGFEPYFKVWFFTNFFTSIMVQLRQSNAGAFGLLLQDIRNEMHDGELGIITAEAYETLLDFQKLEHAKKDTRRALRLSWIAIGISGLLALVQIILQVYALS